MGSYTATITIPGATPDTAPVTTAIRLGERYIRRVQIEFRSAGGLVGVALFDGNSRIYPALGSSVFPVPVSGSQSAWITGDVQTVWLEDDEGVRLFSSPYTLTIAAYNTNVGAKTIEVRIDAANEFLGQHIAALTRAIHALNEKFGKQ
jgi:hypothetical protein